MDKGRAQGCDMWRSTAGEGECSGCLGMVAHGCLTVWACFRRVRRLRLRIDRSVVCILLYLMLSGVLGTAYCMSFRVLCK